MVPSNNSVGPLAAEARHPSVDRVDGGDRTAELNRVHRHRHPEVHAAVR
jgi:hypothetical protein